MALPLSQNVLQDEEIFYPETDGKPMAESDFQRKPLMYAVDALTLHFRETPDVYVSGNLLIYYEQGNPRASVAPDVFAVVGVPKHDRRIYQIWKEGKGTDVVIEMTSKTTWREDEREKPALYQRLGVQEYFQYDATSDYLHPALGGRRLDAQGNYQEIVPTWFNDADLMLESQVLGVVLRLEEGRLRLFDPKTETYLFTYAEQFDARQELQQQLQAEAQARWDLEARVKALEAELARLRSGLGSVSE